MLPREEVIARRWETLWVSLILLALLVVFFWKPIFQGRKLLPVDIAYTDPLYFCHAPDDFVKPHNILLYDQAYQFYPWRVYISDALRQGFLPFWNPYVYCGAPFLAVDQPAVFYPLNVLSYVFSPSDAALFTAMARLFVAGLATYWFVRTIGNGSRGVGHGWWVSRAPQTQVRAGHCPFPQIGALVGAITFTFSGFMIVFLGHPQTNVAAWLPALFLTTEWLYRELNARHVAFVALVVAAQLTGGHAETALYTLTAGGLYFLFRVLVTYHEARGTGHDCEALSPGSWEASSSGESRSSPLATRHSLLVTRNLLLAFAAAMMLGFALASVHVLPFGEWLQYSAEFQLRSGVENLRSWRLGPKYWLAGILPGLLPNIFGNPTWPGEYRSFMPGWNFTEQTIYVGVIGLSLAVAVAFVRRREKPVLFLAVLGVATLGAALRVPVFDWINHLPLFNIASVGRFRLIYTFCMSVLAGLGAQDVLARGKSGAVVRVVIGLLASAMLVGIPILVVMRHVLASMATQTAATQGGPLTPDMILRAFDVSNVWMYWPLLVALAGVWVFVLYLRQVLSLRVMQVMLLSLMIVDLFALGMNYHPAIREELIYPETPALQWIKNDDGVFRVLGTNVDLMPNTCMVHGLYDIRGLDFPIHRYLELCQAMGGQDWLGYGILFTERLQSRLLNLMNVKYVLSSSRLGPEVLRDMSLLGVDKDIKVYQNLACLPRAFIVHRVRVVEDGQDVLRVLQDPEFDLGTEIVLEKAPPPDFVKPSNSSLQAQSRHPSGEANARIERYEPNHVTILASTPAHGFLFLSDTYYPGWRAYVDGIEVEIYPADYAFRAVYLTPGQHAVEFIYAPNSFRLASIVSALALLSVVVLLVKPQSRWSHLPLAARGAGMPTANGDQEK